MVQKNNDPIKMGKTAVLIVGGYGKVGYQIAEHLAEQNDYTITLAGRNREKAIRAASNLGEGAIGEKFDLDVLGEDEIEILKKNKVIIACIDQTDNSFARLCLAQSKIYFDITANTDFLLSLLMLNEDPISKEGLMVTSLGLSPGLSNLLAKEMLNRHPESEEINIGVLLGGGEKHGKAAIEWTIRNLSTDFYYQKKKIKSFIQSYTFRFPNFKNVHRTYRFNFSDQHTLKKMYSAYDFATSLCSDSPFMTRSLHWSKKVGLTKWMRIKWIHRISVVLFSKLSFGSQKYALSVQAVKNKQILSTVSVAGTEEARITAKLAFVCIHRIVKNRNTMRGVYDIQSILSIDEIWGSIKDDFDTYENISDENFSQRNQKMALKRFPEQFDLD